MNAKNTTQHVCSDSDNVPDEHDAAANLPCVRKKVCLVGARGVGKSSLVRRYVDNVFDGNDSKVSGVRVSKASVSTREASLSCVFWDANGDGDCHATHSGYYRGMSGFVLFVDGTRRASIAHARELISNIESTAGTVPFVLALNKVDLKFRWEIAPHETAQLSAKAYVTIETSAKSGVGVATVFQSLADAMLAQDRQLRTAS